MYKYSPSRSKYIGTPEKDICAFCDEDHMGQQSFHTSTGESVENVFYRWVVNTYPKFDGHTLLIPKRHIVSIEDETDEEILARNNLLIVAQKALLGVFPDSGIEVFLQTGSQSGSTIKHLHWHIVPARLDDPLRSFEKMGHFYTTNPKEEKVVIFPVPIKITKEELQCAVQKVL